MSSKDKIIPPETMHSVPPLDTSVSLASLDYNIVEDMKKTHEKISLYELIKIMSQSDILLRVLGENYVNQATSLNKGSGKSPHTLTSILNTLHMEEANSLYHPFLLSFEIFNFNFHKWLVDSSASSNVKPLSVAKKINAQWSKTSAQIIQLDKNFVSAIGELRDVIIRLTSDERVHQCINIVVMDIPNAYGVLLSRDWSIKLQGYFATNWSHLWLPYKGRNNQIWVFPESYMKHNVTALNEENEPLDFIELMFDNCFMETQLGCYLAEPSPAPLDTQLGLLPCPTGENETCIVVCNSISSSNSIT